MVALAEIVAWSAVCGAPCQLVTLDLPAGHMFDQITEIVHQRHLQWLFNWPEIDPRTPVPALRGTFTVNEALRRIFQHTPYTFEFDYEPDGRTHFFWVSRLQLCGVRGGPERRYPIPPCIQQASR